MRWTSKYLRHCKRHGKLQEQTPEYRDYLGAESPRFRESAVSVSQSAPDVGGAEEKRPCCGEGDNANEPGDSVGGRLAVAAWVVELPIFGCGYNGL